MRKKILFVVEAMGGGVFTYIVNLANELVEKYDMFIAYAIRPQTPSDFKNYFDMRIHLIEVKNFVRSINLVKDFKALIEIKKIAQEIKPDIIHLHSSKAGVLGRLAFNGKEAILLYTPHGYSFLMENNTLINRMIFKGIEKVCARRNCMTISCSLGEHQETLKLTKRAMYINNGINMAEIDTLINSIEVKEHPFTVFTLGRICGQKNPKLFNKIAETMPELQFLWIGDGEMRDKLKAPNIKIVGWVERNEALKLSKNADVFLLTSLWEGLPMSLLESMYMRKLCIVSDVIGNRDVIHNGENGFICKTVNEFNAAISTAECGDIKILIENAFTDIERLYNITVMAEQYEKIYSNAICTSQKKDEM